MNELFITMARYSYAQIKIIIFLNITILIMNIGIVNNIVHHASSCVIVIKINIKILIMIIIISYLGCWHDRAKDKNGRLSVRRNRASIGALRWQLEQGHVVV